MNKILLLTSFLLSMNSFADVPHVFSAGTPALASEVNENFSDLNDRVDVIEEKLQEMPSTDLVTYSWNNVTDDTVDINNTRSTYDNHNTRYFYQGNMVVQGSGNDYYDWYRTNVTTEGSVSSEHFFENEDGTYDLRCRCTEDELIQYSIDVGGNMAIALNDIGGTEAVTEMFNVKTYNFTFGSDTYQITAPFDGDDSDILNTRVVTAQSKRQQEINVGTESVILEEYCAFEEDREPIDTQFVEACGYALSLELDGIKMYFQIETMNIDEEYGRPSINIGSSFVKNSGMTRKELADLFVDYVRVNKL